MKNGLKYFEIIKSFISNPKVFVKHGNMETTISSLILLEESPAERCVMQRRRTDCRSSRQSVRPECESKACKSIFKSWREPIWTAFKQLKHGEPCSNCEKKPFQGKDVKNTNRFGLRIFAKMQRRANGRTPQVIQSAHYGVLQVEVSSDSFGHLMFGSFLLISVTTFLTECENPYVKSW